MLGSYFDHVGIILGSFWDLLGSLWDHVGIVLGSFGDKFGIVGILFESLW